MEKGHWISKFIRFHSQSPRGYLRFAHAGLSVDVTSTATRVRVAKHASDEATVNDMGEDEVSVSSNLGKVVLRQAYRYHREVAYRWL
jgi:hypothetical protein